MSKSWFDKGYNGVGPNDDFFDDVIKYLDLPLEDVEGPDGNGSTEDVNNFLLPVEENNDGGEDWDCDFENLEPPPTNVLASLSSGFYGDFFSDSLAQNFTDSVSYTCFPFLYHLMCVQLLIYHWPEFVFQKCFRVESL